MVCSMPVRSVCACHETSFLQSTYYFSESFMTRQRRIAFSMRGRWRHLAQMLAQHAIARVIGLAFLFAWLPAAQAADALNGKNLFLNGPVSGGVSCQSCHGPSPADNVNGILAAANNPAVIANAIANNFGGMGSLFTGKFSAAELADLAAFIGNPAVTGAPAATLTPSSLTFSGTTLGQTSSVL